MDRRLDGGANQGDFDDVGPDLEQHTLLARGTIEQPRLADEPWPLAAVAWGSTLDLDATSGAVFVIDDDAEILAMNTRACTLLGMPEGLIGESIADVLTSDVFAPTATEVPRGVRFVGASAGVVAQHRDGHAIP